MIPTDKRGLYKKWLAGDHQFLVDNGSEEFLWWAANKPCGDKWKERFLGLGQRKRNMRHFAGKKPYPWMRKLELRLPEGCNARCIFCGGFANRDNLQTPSTKYLIKVLEQFDTPESLSLCAEWGDPCLQPKVLNEVARKIESDWMVTRMNLLTNLSVRKSIHTVLPWTQTLLVNFTMASRRDAVDIMGYSSERFFDRVWENLNYSGEECRKNHTVFKIVFVMTAKSIAGVMEHYKMVSRIDGLDSVKYKHSWRGNDINTYNIKGLQQQLAELKKEINGVPYAVDS